MDQNQENNQNIKVRLSNFYHGNKIKIYCFVIILILSLISLVFMKSYNDYKKMYAQMLEKKIMMFYDSLSWNEPVNKKTSMERFF